MLRGLLKIKKIGTIKEFQYLLSDVLSCDKPVSIRDLKIICIDRSFNFAFSYNGTINFLSYLSFIKIDRKGNVVLNCQKYDFKELKDNDFLSLKIIEKVTKILVTENSLSEMFNEDNIGYDINTDRISININLIPLEYNILKQLFINLNFFQPQRNIFGSVLINKAYQSYFEDNILTKLKGVHSESLDIEKFKEIQKIKEEKGEEAEKYVLSFEVRRLKGHSKIDKVRRISPIDVRAGFDIISFENNGSKNFDRFIEVKSFANKIEFFWTKKEIEVARQKKDKYFLYLVDRDRVLLKDYEPIIIRNPYINVYKSENWIKEAKVFHLKKN